MDYKTIKVNRNLVPDVSMFHVGDSYLLVLTLNVTDPERIVLGAGSTPEEARASALRAVHILADVVSTIELAART